MAGFRHPRARPKAQPEGLVPVFGIHAVTSLLQHRPDQVHHLWLQQERQDQRLQAVAALAQGLDLAVSLHAGADLDKQLEGVHQGVVAWVQPRQVGSERDLEQLLEQLAEPALLLVLDGVTDPHNLGACLRSADAAGAHAVIVPKDKSASLNATVRKVACGAAETLPLMQVTNLARTLKSLSSYGVQLLGTAGEADQLIYNADLKTSLALVMGAEGKGLRRLTREHCDQLVKLPMAGAVSSLNVSVAAGICLYEAVRQRLPGC